jgi:hydrogenase maturation protease
MRILIAGFGNPLMGDDGFGIAVVNELRRRVRDPCVTIKEVGNSGLELVHELMEGYDALIIVDALNEGKPGAVYIVSPDLEDFEKNPSASVIDVHYLIPLRALLIARKLGILPRSVYIVGTRAVEVEEAPYQLSEPVYTAVGKAVEVIIPIIDKLKRIGRCSEHG